MGVGMAALLAFYQTFSFQAQMSNFVRQQSEANNLMTYVQMTLSDVKTCRLNFNRRKTESYKGPRGVSHRRLMVAHRPSELKFSKSDGSALDASRSLASVGTSYSGLRVLGLNVSELQGTDKRMVGYLIVDFERDKGMVGGSRIQRKSPLLVSLNSSGEIVSCSTSSDEFARHIASGGDEFEDSDSGSDEADDDEHVSPDGKCPSRPKLAIGGARADRLCVHIGGGRNLPVTIVNTNFPTFTFSGARTFYCNNELCYSSRPPEGGPWTEVPGGIPVPCSGADPHPVSLSCVDGKWKYTFPPPPPASGSEG